MNHHARCATSPSCLRARNANNQARICSHIKEHSDLLIQLTCSRHEKPWGTRQTRCDLPVLTVENWASRNISQSWSPTNAIWWHFWALERKLDLRHLYMRLTPVCGKSDCSETRHLIDFSWTTLHWSCSSHELFRKEQPPTLVASQLSRKRQNSNHWEKQFT